MSTQTNPENVGYKKGRNQRYLQPQYRSDVYAYLELLKGKTAKAIDRNSMQVESQKRRFIGNVWHYVTISILGWTPQQVVDCMNLELASLLKLDHIWNSLNMENRRDMSHDFEAYKIFCVNCAFPDDVRYDERKIDVEKYKNHIRLITAGKTNKYAKGFFASDTRGLSTIRHIMQYLLDPYRGNDAEDMYALFANKTRANQWLKERYIYQINEKETFPDTLHLFHDIAPAGMKDDFWFYFFILENAENTIVKNIKAERRKAKKAETAMKKEAAGNAIDNKQTADETTETANSTNAETDNNKDK